MLPSQPLASPPNASFWLAAELATLYGTWTDEHLASERGLIEYALRFVNREADLDFLKDLPSSSVFDDLRRFRENTREADVQKEAQRRAQLMPLLVGVLTDRRRARAQFLPGAEALLTHISAHPFLRKKRRGASLAYRAIIGDAAALYAFVAVLLLDEGRGFGRGLRRCELESCHRFFLVQPRPGRPRSRFCGEACHSLGAADRMRRLRAARKPK